MYLIIFVISIISMFPHYHIEYREDGYQYVYFYIKCIRSVGNSGNEFKYNSFERLSCLLDTTQ
jgi:hypothetical protein